jgi:hypothetical protein
MLDLLYDIRDGSIHDIIMTAIRDDLRGEFVMCLEDKRFVHNWHYVYELLKHDRVELLKLYISYVDGLRMSSYINWTIHVYNNNFRLHDVAIEKSFILQRLLRERNCA